MISYLSGKIILRKPGFIVLSVGGVGYEVFISAKTADNLPESTADARDKLEIFCYLDVGERSLRLFGFLTYDELELFKTVRAISGVGPKAALQISAVGSLEKINQEIEKGKTDIFENVPGVGKKRAQKILLELSGKLKTAQKLAGSGSGAKSSGSEGRALETDESFLALRNLGFSREQAKDTLSQLPKEITNTEEKIKLALQFLGK